MSRLADDFEGAVGEIIETVSSAATELEASAGTLTSTAERVAGTRNGGRGGLRRSVHQCAVGGFCDRGDVVIGQRDQPSGSGLGADGRRGRRSGAHHQRSRQRIVEGRKPHRRRGRTDQHHRRADQSAGAECHHRGGPRRRGRPRLRGRGLRGQGAGRADREGDRRDRPADHRHPGRDAGVGERHQGNQRHHRKAVRDLIDHRGGGGRAGRGDAGNFPQRAAGGAGHRCRSVSNITDVQRGASETGSASSQVLSAAQSLSGDCNRLKLEVGKFLNSVRAA